jgi:REP element-mobilizing transposase RayT
MPTPRKRHTPTRRKRHTQLKLELKTHGGARTGAGRPPKGPRSSERHKTRPSFKTSEPLHVVVRTEREVGRLRKRHMYKAVREATLCVAKYDDFRIVHLSIQSNHLHLLVEAEHKTALARGMQAFQISAAKQINWAISKRRGSRRRGRVFVDRYFARILKSPILVRRALAYVLNNWRRHHEDRARFAETWKLDPYSSAIFFGGWKERVERPFWVMPPPTYQSLVVWFPRTWLLRESWRRHGLISLYDVPGPLPV